MATKAGMTSGRGLKCSSGTCSGALSSFSSRGYVGAFLARSLPISLILTGCIDSTCKCNRANNRFAKYSVVMRSLPCKYSGGGYD